MAPAQGEFLPAQGVLAPARVAVASAVAGGASGAAGSEGRGEVKGARAADDGGEAGAFPRMELRLHCALPAPFAVPASSSASTASFSTDSPARAAAARAAAGGGRGGMVRVLSGLGSAVRGLLWGDVGRGRSEDDAEASAGGAEREATGNAEGRAGQCGLPEGCFDPLPGVDVVAGSGWAMSQWRLDERHIAAVAVAPRGTRQPREAPSASSSAASSLDSASASSASSPVAAASAAAGHLTRALAPILQTRATHAAASPAAAPTGSAGWEVDWPVWFHLCDPSALLAVFGTAHAS